MKAWTTSDMKAWPTRMSPCGCSSPEVPCSSPRNAGSTKAMLGSLPVAASCVELRDRMRPPEPPLPVEGRERHVGGVVAGGQAARLGAVEDRLPGEPRPLLGLRRQDGLTSAAVLRPPLIVAVGVGGGHDRAEPAVIQRVGLGRVGEERHVALHVVAGRERVAAGARRVSLHEAVHLAVVVLVAPPVPGVVGIAEVAALKVGGQAVGGDRVAVGVRVGEPRVLAVGVRMPAEVVVEGAVLHHQDDEGVDGHVAGLGRARRPRRAASATRVSAGSTAARLAAPASAAVRARKSRRRM